MANTENPIRVLVVAENPFARAGIAAVLATQPELDVIGQCAAESLNEQIDWFRPDTWMLDLSYEPTPASPYLPDIRDIRQPCLVLLNDTSHTLAMLTSGARGVLPHTAKAATISSALHAITHGLVVMSPEVQFEVSRAEQQPLLMAPQPLSARELEVLRLVAEGLPNKQIAARLSISEHTVKFHVNAIMGKLNVQSRTEAVVHATRMGLIAL
jgi:DNA-binding NarL/FixJ family response regulator